MGSVDCTPSLTLSRTLSPSTAPHFSRCLKSECSPPMGTNISPNHMATEILSRKTGITRERKRKNISTYEGFR